MALSAIALCSRALLRLGARSIASFDEGTAEAEVCANLYPVARDALLSAHPWNFATGQARLARLSAVPVADFSHAFQLPGDFLRVLSAGGGGRGRGLAYRIRDRLPNRRTPAVPDNHPDLDRFKGDFAHSPTTLDFRAKFEADAEWQKHRARTKGRDEQGNQVQGHQYKDGRRRRRRKDRRCAALRTRTAGPMPAASTASSGRSTGSRKQAKACRLTTNLISKRM